jgi:hypothetical protein
VRNLIKYGIFLVGTLSLLILNASAMSDPSENSIKLENSIDEPIGIDMCVDFIHYTHEELSNHSDTIVIGTVKEILPSKWNTIDGKRPDKALNVLDYVIYTDIVISVDEYLKNPLSSREIIVRSIGGKVGDVIMTSDAEPSFNTGEKVLLYLRKDTDPATKSISPEHLIVTSFYQSKFTLTDDGRAIGHDENTTLAELLRTINKTVNKKNDNGIQENTETVNKQEGNSSSTIELKTVPFISFFWALAGLLGAVLIVRHRNQ